MKQCIFSVQKINIVSDITSLTLETAGVSPCPIFPWLFQPATAGSAGQFLPRLYITCQKTSTPGQQKRHSAECSETGGVLDCLLCFLSQWWYQIGRQPVGWLAKDGLLATDRLSRSTGNTLSFERYGNSGSINLPTNFLGCVAGAAGGPHGRLVSWFSQSIGWLVQPANEFRGPQRSNSITSHTKYLKSTENWIDSLYGPFFELAHICAIFPM